MFESCGVRTPYNHHILGYVSVTPLHVDLTAHSAREVVGSWLEQAGVDTQW